LRNMACFLTKWFVFRNQTSADKVQKLDTQYTRFVAVNTK